MALWAGTDSNTAAPKFDVAAGVGVAGNGSVLFGNTSTGVFGVSGDETRGQGNVASFSVITAGNSAWGLPVLTVTGANTTQATATVNVAISGVTITAAGTGYANGNTVYAHVGANTTRGVLTVTNVAANGAVLALSITTPGKYSSVTGSNSVSFLANTASGTGLTANIRFGLESVSVNNKGNSYNKGTVGVSVSTTRGLSGGEITATLDGQDASNGVHAGWVLRREGTGGRAGRVTMETLVAMGSMTGDAADDTQLGE